MARIKHPGKEAYYTVDFHTAVPTKELVQDPAGVIATLVGEGATRYICDTLSFFIDRMNSKVKEDNNRCSDADKTAWIEELRRQNLPEKAKSFAQKFFPECCPQAWEGATESPPAAPHSVSDFRVTNKEDPRSPIVKTNIRHKPVGLSGKRYSKQEGKAPKEVEIFSDALGSALDPARSLYLNHLAADTVVAFLYCFNNYMPPSEALLFTEPAIGEIFIMQMACPFCKDTDPRKARFVKQWNSVDFVRMCCPQAGAEVFKTKDWAKSGGGFAVKYTSKPARGPILSIPAEAAMSNASSFVAKGGALIVWHANEEQEPGLFAVKVTDLDNKSYGGGSAPDHDHWLTPSKSIFTNFTPVPRAYADVPGPDGGLVSNGPMHGLHRTWTLWYNNTQAVSKTGAFDDYEGNLQSIYSFDTVENFWRLYNNSKPASSLAVGSMLSLFCQGVRPAYEDPANAAGGRWRLVVPKAEQRRSLDNWWLYTILSVIGETLDDSGTQVLGVICTIKSNEARLEVWTRTANDEASQRGVEQRLKQILRLDDRTKLHFKKHVEAPGTKAASAPEPAQAPEQGVGTEE